MMLSWFPRRLYVEASSPLKVHLFDFMQLLIHFLATREHTGTPAFRKFKKRLFHSSLSRILDSLRPAMKVPKTVLCGDDYYWRVIYVLAAYIADYKEQVLLSCIICGWCLKCLVYRENLDEDALRRCQEHSDMIVDEFKLHNIQENYGLDGDIVVSTSLLFVICSD